MRSVRLLVLIALLPMLASPVFAQSQNSAITGRATDTSGGARPGATITITSPIRVEPHAARYDWVKVWDNRVSKRFGLPGGQSVEAMFYLFNSLNVNTITEQVNRHGPTFLQPTELIAPRVFRLGVRYRF